MDYVRIGGVCLLLMVISRGSTIKCIGANPTDISKWGSPNHKPEPAF